jgi:outer membrane usher protein
MASFDLAGYICLSFAMFQGAANAVVSTLPTATSSAQGRGDITTNQASLISLTDEGDGGVEFNSGLLMGDAGHHANLAQFERGSSVPAGSYNVDVYVNSQWTTRRDLRFAASSNRRKSLVCLDVQLVKSWWLKRSVEKDVLERLAGNDAQCMDIGELIPDAFLRFDIGQLRVDVSIPQAATDVRALAYVPPEYWDQGVPAGLLQYTFNGYRTTNSGHSQSNAYLGINAGVNFGAWRLRTNSTATAQFGGSAPSSPRWRNVGTSVQRNLSDWYAELMIGESYTDGHVFDSFPLLGLQLGSDDRMGPYSQQGFAPLIRGIAKSNARVAITQNGVQIYETTVSPGAFVINDIQPISSGGDLLVTVYEADGRTSSFDVPYAAIVQLLRPGVSRFNVAAGQLRQGGLQYKPTVMTATYQRGISNLMTAYVGMESFDGYGAVLLGSAFNTSAGAVSFDGAQSYARIPGTASRLGQSYRLIYSKLVAATGTSLGFAAYRASSKGYLSLTDAATERDYAQRKAVLFTTAVPYSPLINGLPLVSGVTPPQQGGGGQPTAPAVEQFLSQRRRNQFSFSVSQALAEPWGSVYLSVSSTAYWDQSSNANTNYQAGYSNSWKSLNYGVSANRVRLSNGKYQTQYLLNLTIPLGRERHSPRVSANVTEQSGSGMQQQINVNGTSGESDQVSYGVVGTRQASGDSPTITSTSVNAGYRAPFASVNGSYGEGYGYSQTSVSVSGGVVVVGGGVVFGQTLGETIGVIHAPGAKGAGLTSSAGTQLDADGFALVPHLQPYVMNRVQIDPKHASLDVELEGTSVSVAPYPGAVVMLKFKSKTGHVTVLNVTMRNGEKLPFGASVVTAAGDVVGIVGQSGRVLVRVRDTNVALEARWIGKNKRPESCSLLFQWPAKDKGKGAAPYDEVLADCA